MKFTQPATAREINRLRVLNLLANCTECSRADIARALKLNKPSTSEIIAQLLTDGLVTETGKRETATGRRPISIALAPDAALVLGVDMGSRNTSVALADLKGNILRFERFPTTRQPQVKEFCSYLIKVLTKMTKLTTSPILGIVVALDASISEDQQVLEYSASWQWEDVPLAAILQRHTGLPTLLIHSIEAMVIAEQNLGDKEEEDFFFVNWGEHIKSSWVKGPFHTGGETEFGHIAVSQVGLCRCGKIGCLETVSAGWALSERHGGLTVKQLSQETNPLIQEDLHKAAEAMGTALVAASAITGCQKIILGGGLANLEDQYFNTLRHYYKENSPRAEVSIVRSNLGEKQTLLGSIAIALDTWMFKSSLLEIIESQGN